MQKLKKVTFYSVAINGGDALYDLFLNKHSIENREKLNHILKWVAVIGNKYGARETYFRNEAETADASALPPRGKNRHPLYIEYNDETQTGEEKPNNLRLYCLRANDSLVFLFNGDIKTAHKPQDCKNVKTHFKLANKLTELLNNAFREKQIRWINDYTEIEVDDGFFLYWE